MLPLDADLHCRALLGADVRDLCVAASVSRAWAATVSAALAVWTCALLVEQVPDEAPATYRSCFTSRGVEFWLDFAAALRSASGENREVRGSLALWPSGSALRQLAADRSLQALARFVRLAHSGVEAEALKIGPGSVHMALEVLNFFPVPVWALLTCGDGLCRLDEPDGGLGTVAVRGYMHRTSCAELPERQRGGSALVAQTAMADGSQVSLTYVPPFCRLEIGEHVLHTPPGQLGGQRRLHFAFARSFAGVRASEEHGHRGLEGAEKAVAWRMEELLEARCRGVAADILIPTTRGQHCAMSSEEWARRDVDSPAGCMQVVVAAPSGPPGAAPTAAAASALAPGEPPQGAVALLCTPGADLSFDLGQGSAWLLAARELLYRGSVVLG